MYLPPGAKQETSVGTLKAHCLDSWHTRKIILSEKKLYLGVLFANCMTWKKLYLGIYFSFCSWQSEKL